MKRMVIIKLFPVCNPSFYFCELQRTLQNSEAGTLNRSGKCRWGTKNWRFYHASTGRKISVFRPKSPYTTKTVAVHGYSNLKSHSRLLGITNRKSVSDRIVALPLTLNGWQEERLGGSNFGVGRGGNLPTYTHRHLINGDQHGLGNPSGGITCF